MESTYVRFDLFEASKELSETERKQLEARVVALESRSEWVIRTIGAIIIAAVIGVVLTTSKGAGGG